MDSNTPGFKVVSYYTPKYTEVAKRLTDSLDKFKIPYEVEPQVDLGGWQANINYKPYFCLKKWFESDTPIVFIDADGEVKQYPELFKELTVDFACHFRDDINHKNELLSGTAFFNKTTGASKILHRWVEATKENEYVWDQRVLQQVIEATHDISIYRLPPSYTQIFDTMSRHGDPVIEHFQHSREAR